MGGYLWSHVLSGEGGYLWSHGLSLGGWVSLIPGPIWGTVYVWGLGISVGWCVQGVNTHPWGRVCRGGYVATHPARCMGPGILQDTVDKWVVCILLECFLVLFNVFCSLYILLESYCF